MKKLSHEFRWTLVLLVPCFSENQKVGAGQPQASIWRGFVDYDLGIPGVQFAAVHQVSVHIVEPHCARIWTTHAAELKSIPLRLSHGDILEALGIFPDNFEKCARLLLPIRRHF